MKHLLYVILISLLCACQPAVKEAPDVAKDEFTCPETRPQICTMIYDPVCAQHKDGQRTTEASNCTACSDSDVMTYRMGACDTSP
ncbi:hypothetical protein P886_0657 [Alteromonadaceae bacterium 2753L.S.0a.02]|nr:hypothetical protein P886_0657 [Alteromonadaceae bacterium 2753L.S.0a.02]